MKNFCIHIAVFFIVVSSSIYAQTLDRQVINSNGGSGNAGSNVQVDFSIGEPIVVTANGPGEFYTQGFIQPDTVFYSTGVFSVNIFFGTESCINASDAYIYANPVNANGNVSWSWFPTFDTTSTLTNLSPGTYILTATDTAGNSITDTVIIAPSTSPCDLDFYNAITPNGDGKNDFFVISNISNYPNNTLIVFNRYGIKVWEGKNYDNTSVYFEGKDLNGVELNPATYFYVLAVDGGERKGWLEILR